ncbi:MULTISPECIES: GNAT family N-acetyltransferase [unclassified Pseudomonas]|uniref:peptidogalycan biosysnthesis protein n=1 Tax=unclassified Pseudomonas TaxID=196821 RepID=UPI00128BF50D|nr:MULTISPECIES: GNAT family N-acetyltransferase [unclassified Pseudomonas]MPQ70635.1 GNAT family N-acetyltransferase [Pseudomonas sp. MWU12-2323]
MLQVQWASHAASVPATLWESCFSGVEGRWWYEALEEGGLEDQFEFAYAILEKDGQPIGLAPTFIMNVPMELVVPPVIAKMLRVIPTLRYQRTLFVGSPCSDEGTIGLLPGYSLADILGPLQDALSLRAKAKNAAMTVWKDFGEAQKAAFEGLCATRGLFPMVSFPGTAVELAPGGFEGYLKTLKSRHRYLLKKKLKHGLVPGALTVQIVQQPDEETLQALFSLFLQTYEKGKTKFEKLTYEFFQQIALKPESHFILLSDGTTGKMVAFMLCFLLGDKAINKFIGIDYQVGKQAHLYFQLWEQAVKWSYSVGATRLDSGQTGYRVKRELGHQLVALDCYCRHRNPLLHRVFGAVAKGITLQSLDPDLQITAEEQ